MENLATSIELAESVGIMEIPKPEEVEETALQKSLLEKILNTLEDFGEPVKNTIIEFSENIRVHDRHYDGKGVFASYTYEDDAGMTHIKRKYLLAKFPIKETYKSLITSILDEFWTPYNSEHSTKKLEEQLLCLFKEMSIELVIFEKAKVSLSDKPVVKLLNFLNNRLEVSVIFVNLKLKRSSV